MANIESRYLDGAYLTNNPTWDREDASWKAGNVAALLADHKIEPAYLCEVGCGHGDVLKHLRKALPRTRMTGFDISPQASQFWRADDPADAGLDFIMGDFHRINRDHYDVLLMLDVFEHVRDPFTFLEASRSAATHFVFHIPLDLSASSVIRSGRLMEVRRKVGHIHYYTKDLALATLQDSGYDVLEWRYTGASLRSPNRSFKTRLAAMPRRLVFAVNRDFGARLLGGETLVVLAKPTFAST